MADVEYIGMNKPDGMCLGLSATEKIAFYGGTPLVQGTTAAIGTDAATTQALANSIKVYLEASGLMAE
jgi:hypothetical protein